VGRGREGEGEGGWGVALGGGARVSRAWRILRGEKVKLADASPWLSTRAPFPSCQRSFWAGTRLSLLTPVAQANRQRSFCYLAARALSLPQVMVTSGRDKGLTGTVTAVLRARNRAIVEGRNLVCHWPAPPLRPHTHTQIPGEGLMHKPWILVQHCVSGKCASPRLVWEWYTLGARCKCR